MHHHHGRILIDFMDPLIVAEKIANTFEDENVRTYEISELLGDDSQRVGGRNSRGKKRKIYF